MTTDIFTPYEIAKQLKEIGFNEPCLAYYDEYKSVDYNITEDNVLLVCYNKKLFENDIEIISAPTWEQVFKWFRDKGFCSEIIFYRSSFKSNITISDEGGIIDEYYLKARETYEQARENLVLELIKIYKNQKYVKQ